MDHKGPLKPGDSEHNGSRYNIKIEWEGAGVTTWEPLTIIGKCDLVTCAVHAKEHGLLNEPGWKQFKKHARKAKTLQCLVNNSKRAQQFGQIVYKFGVHIPCNKKEAIMLDCEKGMHTGRTLLKKKPDSCLSTKCSWIWERMRLYQKDTS